MAKQFYDLGPVLGIEPEALGVPGQRTFRIQAHSPAGAARLWLEKEQLQALAAAVEQLLTEVSPARSSASGGEGGALPFPALSTIEFHIGRITLGYDQLVDQVTMTLYEVVPGEEEGPNPLDEDAGDRVELQTTREQAHAFSRQAVEVCAAGRPRCPLCGTPLDGPTHFCPRSNGHAPLPHDED